MTKETQTAPSALETQKGGDHYKNQKIQPIQYSMTNGWDACAHSILKHVSRHRKTEKGGRLDIEKAIHYTQLREELVRPHNLPRAPGKRHIPMTDYVVQNNIDGMDAIALGALYEWVNYPESQGALVLLRQSLNSLLESYGT